MTSAILPSNQAMRIYQSITVVEATRKRLRWLFSEFDNVMVCISGGKDSSVLAHLSLEVARELNRLPLNLFFLDQEAEWQVVIDHIRRMMHQPGVRPLWYQVPFRMSNSTSTVEQWLYAWDPNDEIRWMRPKEPDSIHENNTGEDRFKAMFWAALREQFGTEKACSISGVRAEESPTRRMGLTWHPSYKWVTWGTEDPGKKTKRAVPHYVFYPLYDWTLSDVWKTINDLRIPYCQLYDLMYQHGIPDWSMRVSNVHHETALGALFFLQELEPHTWERLTQRLEGIDMTGKLGLDYWPDRLPPMFGSWYEYRDYLLEHLITVPEWREKMRKRFGFMKKWEGKLTEKQIAGVQIKAILSNDHEMVKVDNWEAQMGKRMRVRENPW